MNLRDMPFITLKRLIDQAKEKLQSDPVIVQMFDEYGADIEELKYIPTYFKDLDVSAKTDHGVVYLNYALLDDGFSEKQYSYLVHEYSHWLQQTYGNKPTKSSKKDKYLDNEFEIEGFQNQIEYLANKFDNDTAENYVNNLLNHHKIPQKNKEDKKDELMAKL